VAYIAREDISTSYVSHLEIVVVLEERPNNSDLVFCRKHRSARANPDYPHRQNNHPCVRERDEQAGSGGEQAQGEKIRSFDFVKSSTVP